MLSIEDESPEFPAAQYGIDVQKKCQVPKAEKSLPISHPPTTCPAKNRKEKSRTLIGIIMLGGNPLLTIGEKMAEQTYPEQYRHIREMMGTLGKEIPGTMQGFQKLHQAAASDGVLGAKIKELIALGIAITVRCHGCIAFHVHDALEAGASREEVMETIGVAILMGGGPSVMYGVEACEALEQFLAEATA